jgi:hypothetical protein
MIGSTERATLELISARLNASPDELYRLIRFESKWNPKAKNPRSTARGLLQFTDSTAQSLGYKNSLDLVNKNPTVTDQLFVVEKYLARYAPFSGKQSLYMSVFYPAARKWNPAQQFPAAVQAVNPGIRNPSDYIRLVDGATVAKLAIVPIIAGAVLLYLFLNRMAQGNE